MPFIKFTTDRIVKRLRWLMVCVILSDSIITLLGQPGTYWQSPQTAHEDNPFFQQYLIRGYVPFCVSWLVYATFAFLVVSILPRRAALAGIFAYIFAHFYGATTWLMFHWKFGGTGFIIYSIVLGVAIVLLAFPAPSVESHSQ